MQKSWRPAALLNRDCSTFSCAYSESFRDCLFLESNSGGCFWSKFSYQKRFFKKKVNGEIAFALISLFHVKIYKAASRSTTTRAYVFLVKFIVADYLKQEVDGDISICIDEPNPISLSITGDIKIYQCHVIKM